MSGPVLYDIIGVTIQSCRPGTHREQRTQEEINASPKRKTKYRKLKEIYNQRKKA